MEARAAEERALRAQLEADRRARRLERDRRALVNAAVRQATFDCAAAEAARHEQQQQRNRAIALQARTAAVLDAAALDTLGRSFQAERAERAQGIANWVLALPAAEQGVVAVASTATVRPQSSRWRESEDDLSSYHSADGVMPVYAPTEPPENLELAPVGEEDVPGDDAIARGEVVFRTEEGGATWAAGGLFGSEPRRSSGSAVASMQASGFLAALKSASCSGKRRRVL